MDIAFGQDFLPGWTPSWEGTDLLPEYCEDSLRPFRVVVMDAIRVSDEKRVMIKRTRRESRTEGEVARFLSSPSLGADPANHCVPILDIINDPTDAQVYFIVMPLLREFDDPPFAVVSEVVEFVRQTLTGMVFMHKSGLAHLDCTSNNIMMDASEMYPKGFHPTRKHKAPDGISSAKCISGAKRVKYYFIDFEMSRLIKRDSDRQMCVRQGGRNLPPEIERGAEYDPFPVDMYYLGNVYREHVLEKYANMYFLRPLVESMIREDPKARPSEAQALAQFTSLVSSRSGYSLRWRLRRKRMEGRWSSVLGDIKSGSKEAFFVASTILFSPFRAIQAVAHVLRRGQAVLSED